MYVNNELKREAREVVVDEICILHSKQWNNKYLLIYSFNLNSSYPHKT